MIMVMRRRMVLMRMIIMINRWVIMLMMMDWCWRSKDQNRR